MSFVYFLVQFYQGFKGVQICRSSQWSWSRHSQWGAHNATSTMDTPPEVTQNALDCRCGVEKKQRTLCSTAITNAGNDRISS